MSRENAKTTLRKVAEQLISLANQGVDNAETTTSSNILPSTASAEHRRLFNYMPRSSRVFRPSPSSKGKGKAKLQTSTLKLFCLAKVDQEKPPGSVAGKTTLSNCGLGPGNITVDLHSNSIHNNLIERFPLLEAAGGYELLLYQRGGEEQGFHSLPTPYTPARIKEVAGQAIIYIRPLQKNLLDLSDESFPRFQESEQPLESGPLVQCLQCEKRISMHELRRHKDDVHPNKRKRSSTQSIDDLKSESQPDVEVPINVDDFDDLRSKTCTTLTSSDHESTSGFSADAKEEDLVHLKDMFPDKSLKALKESLTLHGTLTKTVLSLAGVSEPSYDEDDDDSELIVPALQVSLEQILAYLQKNFSDEKEKLKIEEEDLFNDAITYYKDPAFDPRKKLRIVYRGQPAADTGGVTRQFFTQLLQNISDTFFQGEHSKIPIYNADVVASGMMKLIGTIIVHSILQGGPGFPVFSPSLYKYLSSGSIEKAMQLIVQDDCSMATKAFIEKVTNTEDVACLDQEEVSSTLAECGLPFALKNDNRMRVVQGVIVHDVLGKRKIVLDQLREGLNVLGFMEKLESHPDLFETLFVIGKNDVRCQDIVDILEFPNPLSDQGKKVKSYLTSFLTKATTTTLKEFLIFATGCPFLPNFGFGKILIKFEDVTSIFASTCLQSITFPNASIDEELFLSLFPSVLRAGGKSFNCV